MCFRSTLLVVAAFLLANPALAKERTWTDSDGRQIKAEFVREANGVVTFLKDGKLVTVKLDRLSEKDQQVIRDLAAGRPVADDETPVAGSKPAGASAADSKAPADSGAGGSAVPKIVIEVRTWTDERGQQTNAKFVRTNGTDVVLNRAGRILTVSYYSLSEDDQQYVRDVLTQQGKANLIPPERVQPTNNNGGSPADGGAGVGVAGGGVAAPGIGTGVGTPGPGPGFPGGAGGPRGGPPGIGGGGMGPRGVGPGGMGRPGGMAPGGMGGAGPIGGGAMPGGGMPGGMGGAAPIGGGGMPGAGMPGGGMPAGIGGGIPSGVPDLSAPGGASVPGMPGGSMGSTPRSGMGSGIGAGGMPSANSTLPNFPSSPLSNPSLPPIPVIKHGYKCSGCQREIDESQTNLDRCPYCGTYWVYKQDLAGNKQFNGTRNARGIVVGVAVVVGLVLLGAVGGFIGIVVAIVRVASRPARRSEYRQW